MMPGDRQRRVRPALPPSRLAQVAPVMLPIAAALRAAL